MPGILLQCFVLTVCVLGSEANKLLVLMLDGFRWDYIDTFISDPKGFQRITEEGAHAEYLIPPFPSVTYTSLYSIVTGLHPESHGIVGNNMWDEREKETFEFGANPEQVHPHWWNGGEPVWITATRQNKVVSIYEWLGCEVLIRQHRPTSCIEYPGYYPTDYDAARRKLVDQLTSALDDIHGGKDLVMVYFELSDFLGHLYGPASPEVGDIVRLLDAQLDDLLTNISERGLNDVLNIMVISDHGMTDISESKVIHMTQCLHNDEYERIIDHGPITNIWPTDGMERKVYDKLRSCSTHMTVYMKHKLPTRWCHKNHFRVAPITCIADTGWMILTNDDRLPSNGNTTYSGYHGYDNIETDMRAIFYAVGPNISKRRTLEALDNIHLYQLMCKILRKEAAPNNGSWTKVKDIYHERSLRAMPTMITLILFVGIACILVFVLFTVHSKRKQN